VDVLSQSTPSARLKISLIITCGIAAEQLAFTAGFEAVLEDEGESLDAWLSNSETLPLLPLSIFTDNTSKNKTGAAGRTCHRKIK